MLQRCGGNLALLDVQPVVVTAERQHLFNKRSDGSLSNWHVGLTSEQWLCRCATLNRHRLQSESSMTVQTRCGSTSCRADFHSGGRWSNATLGPCNIRLFWFITETKLEQSVAVKANLVASKANANALSQSRWWHVRGRRSHCWLLIVQFKRIVLVALTK